jgi:hypothetical protein
MTKAEQTERRELAHRFNDGITSPCSGARLQPGHDLRFTSALPRRRSNSRSTAARRSTPSTTPYAYAATGGSRWPRWLRRTATPAAGGGLDRDPGAVTVRSSRPRTTTSTLSAER